MRRPLILTLALPALGLTLAACSSGATTSSAAGHGGTPPVRATSPTATTAPPPTGGTPGGVHGTGTATGSSASIPAVAQPTNQKVEPVVSPGTPPPPTGLITKDLVVGTGATATASSTVLVKYVGADYTNGKDFTSSTWTSNQATSFSLHGVVPGFAQGITGMKVGGRREIVIPPALGYQAAGSPPVIGPNETLVFVVDLEGVQ